MKHLLEKVMSWFRKDEQPVRGQEVDIVSFLRLEHVSEFKKNSERSKFIVDKLLEKDFKGFNKLLEIEEFRQGIVNDKIVQRLLKDLIRKHLETNQLSQSGWLNPTEKFIPNTAWFDKCQALFQYPEISECSHINWDELLKGFIDTLRVDPSQETHMLELLLKENGGKKTQNPNGHEIRRMLCSKDEKRKKLLLSILEGEQYNFQVYNFSPYSKMLAVALYIQDIDIINKLVEINTGKHMLSDQAFAALIATGSEEIYEKIKSGYKKKEAEQMLPLPRNINNFLEMLSREDLSDKAVLLLFKKVINHRQDVCREDVIYALIQGSRNLGLLKQQIKREGFRLEYKNYQILDFYKHVRAIDNTEVSTEVSNVLVEMLKILKKKGSLDGILVKKGFFYDVIQKGLVSVRIFLIENKVFEKIEPQHRFELFKSVLTADGGNHQKCIDLLQYECFQVVASLENNMFLKHCWKMAYGKGYLEVAKTLLNIPSVAKNNQTGGVMWNILLEACDNKRYDWIELLLPKMDAGLMDGDYQGLLYRLGGQSGRGQIGIHTGVCALIKSKMTSLKAESPSTGLSFSTHIK